MRKILVFLFVFFLPLPRAFGWLGDATSNELVRMTQKIVEAGGKFQTLYIAFGRSPTPIVATLSSMGIPVIVIPISGFKDPSYEMVGQAGRAKIVDYMKMQLPEKSVFSGEHGFQRIAVMDFYAVGTGYFQSTKMVREAIQSKYGYVPRMLGIGWAVGAEQRPTDYLQKYLPVDSFTPIIMKDEYPNLANSFRDAEFDELSPFGKLPAAHFGKSYATAEGMFNSVQEVSPKYLEFKEWVKSNIAPRVQKALDCKWDVVDHFD